MMRTRQHRATDAHEGFTAWLQGGAPGEPPRDLALHAAFCADCRAAMAAFDLLSTIDTGRAPMPPSRPAARPPRRRMVSPRLIAAGASLVILAAGGWAVTSGRLPVPLGAGSGGSPSPVQQVLGGFGAGHVVSPTPSLDGASSPAEPSATEASESSDAASLEPGATPGPVTTAGPDVTGPADPSSPRPTATARPTRHPSPSGTATPTEPPPSVDPTAPPTAEPTPTPDDCDDGVDNDGDLLVDIADPGCVVDSYEAAA
jgi:hypothetical protein